jgi:hypothetical protein
MKKIKLIIVAVAMLSLVSSSAVFADGFAPGEGLYIGAFVAGSMGIVQPKVATTGNIFGTTVNGTGDQANHPGGSWEANDGGLGLAGIEGGGTVGYGYKMGDLYAGLEGEMAAGDVKFKLSGTEVELASGDLITAVEAKKDWTGGMFGRLGFYVNPDTLLAFRGGVLVSKFDVSTTGTNQNFSETFYGGGPSVGASIESRLSAVDPNLSIRLGAVYTDFLTANVFGLGTNTGMNDAAHSGHDSEVTGSALSARIGVQYSFFDVNTLF